MNGFQEKRQQAGSANQGAQVEKGFSNVKALLDAMGGITLSQVCTVTGLEGSTIQNWVKRGWVSNPSGKKYEERHIARILIINALKECIKLEHISLLMGYVNNCAESQGEPNIKESELYDYLCLSLQMLKEVDDLSRGGVESVVDKVMKAYSGPTIDARMRIRKALTVMIYACVCTDVKRGTEAMMMQILRELENPELASEHQAEDAAPAEAAAVEKAAEETNKAAQPLPKERPLFKPAEKPAAESRKTISQALREWGN